MKRIHCAARGLAGAFLLGCCAAHAGVFKCTNASGKTTFQQQPCPQDSTAGKVGLSAGDWTRVGSARVKPNTAGHILVDTDLDEARLKRVGANVVATFRMTEYHREGNDRRQPRTYYALYDCAHGLVAGPDESVDQLAQPYPDGSVRNPLTAFAIYQKYREDLVFGEPAVVARICGSPQGRATANASPAAPGAAPALAPESDAISAAKPEGVNIEAISQNGEWTEVRGTAYSSDQLGAFMRNIEAARIGSPVLKHIQADAEAGSKFVFAVRRKSSP